MAENNLLSNFRLSRLWELKFLHGSIPAVPNLQKYIVHIGAMCVSRYVHKDKMMDVYDNLEYIYHCSIVASILS